MEVAARLKKPSPINHYFQRQTSLISIMFRYKPGPGEGGGGVLGGGGVGGTGPPPQLPGFTETSSIAISDRQDVPLIPSKVS